MTWGWRIPFLISFIPVLIGLAIRMRVTESPEYLRVADAGKPQRPPVIDVLRSHWRQVLVVVGAHMAPNIWGYTMTVLILSYATTYAGYSRSALLLAVTIGAVVETLTIPWFGSLADRYGQRPVYIAGLVGMAVWAFPFFLIVREGSVPCSSSGWSPHWAWCTPAYMEPKRATSPNSSPPVSVTPVCRSATRPREPCSARRCPRSVSS